MLECCGQDKAKCSFEVDEYYCTDGGLIPLCGNHLKECRVVVWDGDHPITKKYYDEVYNPKIDRRVIKIPELEQRLNYKKFLTAFKRSMAVGRYLKRVGLGYKGFTENGAEIYQKYLAVCLDDWKEKFEKDTLPLRA